MGTGRSPATWTVALDMENGKSVNYCGGVEEARSVVAHPSIVDRLKKPWSERGWTWRG